MLKIFLLIVSREYHEVEVTATLFPLEQELSANNSHKMVATSINSCIFNILNYTV